MSLLLLFAGATNDAPEPPTTVPQRTLMGVGLTLALLVAPLGAVFL